jgi:hypothetical protein
MLPLLCVLLLLSGCQSTEMHSAGGESLASQPTTENGSKIVCLVDGKITAEAPGKLPASKEVEIPTSSVQQLVESDLGFAEIQGHVSRVGRRTLVEVLADTRAGSVTVDLFIEIPEGVRYNIRSNHDQIAGFEGLKFSREDNEPIEADCGRLKPGRYRINGMYKVDDGSCAQFEWVLELHRPFDVPPDPTAQPVPVPQP